MKTPTTNIRYKALMGVALMISVLAGCATQGLSDGMVNANHKGYELQQGSIKTLNDSTEHRVASYSLAKAQCWLDVSYHEYSRNDRSKFVPEALTESQRITDYLSAGGATDGLENPANTTHLVNNAALLRQDLWDMTVNLKQQPGMSCASQQIACAEVELVHAGNEYNQQGWRHAKPYVQLAEDLIGAASTAVDRCNVSSDQSQNTTGTANKPFPMLINVLFNFDQYAIEEARPASMRRLEEVIAQLNDGRYKLAGLQLTGHADKSNNTGDANYNLLLSQRRAKTVLNYLNNNGVDVTNTPISHRGDTEQVSSCEIKRNNRAQYRECLLPNRRVEVNLLLLQ